MQDKSGGQGDPRSNSGSGKQAPHTQAVPSRLHDKIEADARGQFKISHEGSHNSGVISADPRVISGKESGDATFPIDGPSKPPKGK